MWTKAVACGTIAAAATLLLFWRRRSPPPAEVEADEEEVEAAEAISVAPSLSELSEEEDSSWISRFVADNEFLCEVDRSYIADSTNLVGLFPIVPLYREAMSIILDVMLIDETLTEEQQWVFGQAAEMLYGLIHARYILTSRGMVKMGNKFHEGAFGQCARIFCEEQNVLPAGRSDNYRQGSAVLYCPRCKDIFHPGGTPLADIDGSFFGTNFAPMFMLEHPKLIPPRPSEAYIPKLYGFKIRQSSRLKP